MRITADQIMERARREGLVEVLVYGLGDMADCVIDSCLCKPGNEDTGPFLYFDDATDSFKEI